MQGKIDATNASHGASGPPRRNRLPFVIVGIIVVAAIGLFLAMNLMQAPEVFAPVDQDPKAAPEPVEPEMHAVVPAPKSRDERLSVILTSADNIWGELLARADYNFKAPKAQFFEGSISSACGFDKPVSGPFYCAGEKLIYLDGSWFSDLEQRFGTVATPAQAYVIGHEISHHVQNLAGITSWVNQASLSGIPMDGVDGLVARKELQADCLTGVWLHYAQRGQPWLAVESIEEVFKAVEAVALERQKTPGPGVLVPDPLTHANLELRIQWLKLGLQEGDALPCMGIFGQGRR